MNKTDKLYMVKALHMLYPLPVKLQITYKYISCFSVVFVME